MRVVVVHNRYRSAQPSGENRVVEADIAALEAEGVEVFPYIRDSDEIDGFTAIGKAGVAVRPLVSPVDSIAFRRLLREVQPHIVHLHNPYPLISPWIVRTAKAMRVPVVQTVHNYRHVCANGLYFRDGHECTDCVGKSFPWPAIQHGCYRDSKLQSIPMATSLWAHRNTWLMVDRFLPVGEHVADHLRAFGIPDHKIIVRPNVVADPGEPKPLGHGALFVGRLSEEKGIRLLLDAWKLSGVGADHTLTIAGDGELRPVVEAAAAADPSIRYLGLVLGSEVPALYDAAALVVVPSLWPEPDPLVAIGAFAASRAVLACRLGAMAHYIDDGSGWLTEPIAADMSRGLEIALASRDELDRKGEGARKQFAALRSPTSRLGLGSVYESLASVPRGSIVVVGPDGAGKSTLAASLADIGEAANVEVVRSHFRPGILLRSRIEGAIIEDPHFSIPRPSVVAIPRTVVVWLDFLVGAVGPWRRASRRGLLLLERPWIDQAVDPRRYRLPKRTLPLIRLLAKLLPRADVVVHLNGDPKSIDARKPEIGEAEVARQQNEWLAERSGVGDQVVVLDSVEASPADSAKYLVAELSPAVTLLPTDWVHPRAFPSRLEIKSTRYPAPVAAFGIYRPQRKLAILRHRAALMSARLRSGESVAAPGVPIAEVLDVLGLDQSAVVATRSSTDGRWVLGVERGGVLSVVVKCGRIDDQLLRSEAIVLGNLSTIDSPFRVPVLEFAGAIGAAFVVATRAIQVPRDRRPSLDRIVDIVTSMTSAQIANSPLVHGDLAPWNVIADGSAIWLLDWEESRAEYAPLWDLSHYVVQMNSLLGAGSPAQAVQLLCAPNGPGHRHLIAVGESPDLAQHFLIRYLETSREPDSSAGRAFRAQMRRVASEQ